MGKINMTALKDALLTALYVVAIGTVLYFGGQAKIGRENSFLVPISILLMLVCSASITGYLMVGKPILLYIDGKKKEAISLLAHTLVYFSIITFVAIALMISLTR